MAKKRKKAKKKRVKKSKKTKTRRVKSRSRAIKRAKPRKKRVKKVKRTGYKPLIAAILNFFLWGSGFMYAGRYVFGLLWLMAAVTLLIPLQFTFSTLPTSVANYTTAGYFMISFLLAWDAYYDEVVRWRIKRR